MKRISSLVVGLGIFALALPVGCGKKDGNPSGVGRLNAGGSTFVGPMMKKWASVYQKEKGTEIDYALKGSGNGIQQMTAKTYHFGCTDAPMNEDQLQKAKDAGGPVVHIPLVMGAVVPIYNLPDLKGGKPLNFTGEVLGDIFLGKIDKWNHEDLKKINPGVDLPDQKISVVRRAEPSGTTFIWTTYLAGASPAWKEQLGPGRLEIKWPTGVGEQGNPGVAGRVSNSPGSIGYVELLYALDNKIPFGAVQNADKSKFIHADMDNVTEAAKGAEADIPDDLCFTLTNKPGPEAYPICGMVWAVLYQNQPADTGKAVVDYLRWAVHDGQQYAKGLHYAPLSEGLVKKVDQKLDSIKIGK
jgi:phosphate transport system substrate-binding protein